MVQNTHKSGSILDLWLPQIPVQRTEKPINDRFALHRIEQELRTEIRPKWEKKEEKIRQIRAKMVPEKALEAELIRTPIGANQGRRLRLAGEATSRRLRCQLDQNLIRKTLMKAQLNNHR